LLTALKFADKSALKNCSYRLPSDEVMGKDVDFLKCPVYLCTIVLKDEVLA